MDATKDTWNAPVTTWEAGATVEAAYSIQANHAGGRGREIDREIERRGKGREERDREERERERQTDR